MEDGDYEQQCEEILPMENEDREEENVGAEDKIDLIKWDEGASGFYAEAALEKRFYAVAGKGAKAE